jgi:hypothetical protein
MGPAWNGHAYIDGNGLPQAARYLNALWKYSDASIPTDLSAQLPPDISVAAGKSVTAQVVTDPQLRTQLKAWQLSAVVAVTVPSSMLGKYLTVILGHPTVASGDVMAWRVS